MKNIPQAEDELVNWASAALEPIRHVPHPDPQTMAAARQRYLAEARFLEPAVSKPGRFRLNQWNDLKINFLQRKMRPAMTTIISIALALSLLLGGGSVATVYASQDSLPDQALYPLKLLTEDIRMQLTGDPQTQARLNLEFTSRRIEEVSQLILEGKTPGEGTLKKVQEQLDRALLQAAGTGTEEKQPALENLANNLERHEEQLLKLEKQANPRAAAEFARVVEMLRLRLELAEKGVKDPQALHQLKSELQNQIQEQFRKTPESKTTDGSEKSGGKNQPGGQGINQGKGNGPDKDRSNDKDKGQGPGGQVTTTPQPDSGTTNPKDPQKTPPGLENKNDKPGGSGQGGGNSR